MKHALRALAIGTMIASSTPVWAQQAPPPAPPSTYHLEVSEAEYVLVTSRLNKESLLWAIDFGERSSQIDALINKLAAQHDAQRLLAAQPQKPAAPSAAPAAETKPAEQPKPAEAPKSP